jgi:hypothetical protein
MKNNKPQNTQPKETNAEHVRIVTKYSKEIIDSYGYDLPPENISFQEIFKQKKIHKKHHKFLTGMLSRTNVIHDTLLTFKYSKTNI